MQSVREEERTRIARTIHDELGQALTGLKMDVVWLQKHLDQPQPTLLAKTQAMSQLIDATIQTVRRISTELRPGILDDLGLVATLTLRVQDNGRGITKREIYDPKSIGLLGMQERARLRAGEVQFQGIPGKGTIVTVRVPLSIDHGQ